MSSSRQHKMRSGDPSAGSPACARGAPLRQSAEPGNSDHNRSYLPRQACYLCRRLRIRERRKNRGSSAHPRCSAPPGIPRSSAAALSEGQTNLEPRSLVGGPRKPPGRHTNIDAVLFGVRDDDRSGRNDASGGNCDLIADRRIKTQKAAFSNDRRTADTCFSRDKAIVADLHIVRHVRVGAQYYTVAEFCANGCTDEPSANMHLLMVKSGQVKARDETYEMNL